MKVRFDYVSNSSSCSFIVDDAKSAMNAFEKEFGKNYDYRDMLYGIEDVNFYLYGKKDALEKIKSCVEYNGAVEQSYSDDNIYILGPFSLCTMISIPNKMLKDVKSIEVSADDCNSANVMIVRMLRVFFDSCLLSTKDVGDKWSGLDGDDFMSKLLRKIISNNS